MEAAPPTALRQLLKLIGKLNAAVRPPPEPPRPRPPAGARTRRKPLFLFALPLLALPTPPLSAVTFIGECNAASTSCTPPAHAVGDLFMAFAGRNASITSPTLPSGWTSVTTMNVNGTNPNRSAARLACKVATTTSETATGFTNASHLSVLIYRGQLSGLTAVCASTILGTPANFTSTNDTTTTTATFNAVTNQDAKSWDAAFGYCSACTAGIDTAPSGLTNRNSNGSGPAVGGHDTNGGVSSFSSANVTLTTAGRILTTVVEIKNYNGGMPVVMEAN